MIQNLGVGCYCRSKLHYTLSFALLFALLLLPLAVSAESEQYYVTTHLQTGLHTKAAMDSPVVKLVTGGEAIEVLQAGKEFSQVQLKDGTKGWLYSQFIIPEKPAEARVTELENQLADLQEQLGEEHRQPVTNISNNETELQSQLEEYQATIASLKEELKAWEQLDFQDRQAQQEHALQINSQLKQRLSQIAALATGQDESSIKIKVDDEVLEEEPPLLSKSWFKKEYLLIIVIGGAGFFLGILVMDLINRRRHGGYRI